MTVTSVLLNFREGLFVLVPVLERIGIAWKRPDAYDDWDAIATTLFDKLVVEVIRWSLPDEAKENFRLPTYDLLLPTYSSVSTLEVSHPLLPPGRWLFHAFGTRSEPFDLVEVRSLSKDGRPITEELETCPVDGAEFRLRLSYGAEFIKEIEMVDS